MQANLADKAFGYLSDNERNALKELKEKINEKYPGTELILYGSKARGNFSKDSDVDILVLINKINPETERGVSDIIVDELIKTGIPLNEILVEKALLESYIAEQIPFYKNVKNEGVRI